MYTESRESRNPRYKAYSLLDMVGSGNQVLEDYAYLKANEGLIFQAGLKASEISARVRSALHRTPSRGYILRDVTVPAVKHEVRLDLNDDQEITVYDSSHSMKVLVPWPRGRFDKSLPLDQRNSLETTDWTATSTFNAWYPEEEGDVVAQLISISNRRDTYVRKADKRVYVVNPWHNQVPELQPVRV